MINRTTLLFLLMSTIICTRMFAQGGGINAPEMNKVLPPAPNAFELTKYSGLPINLSSGSVSTSIPLGDVKHGKVSVPISLSYTSGNGIKVNQIASRVGMGWVLNAGGVITRSMAGKPDETSTWLKVPSNLSSDTDSVFNYLNQVTTDNGLYDSEPDVFAFNFNGYSGQFILKPTDRTQVIFLSPSPLKVVTNFHSEHTGDWNLLVIDPNGVKYYFGGTGATEKSKTSPEGSSCGKVFAAYIPNAWYLKSIKNNGGEQVWFNYVACQFDYYADVSETLIRTPLATLSDYYNPAPTYSSTGCPIKTENQVCASNLRNAGVILKSISSRLFKVNFAYASRSDINGDSLLTGIDFYKKDPVDTTALTKYKSFQLTYTHSTNTTNVPSLVSTGALMTRPFLTKVAQLDSAKSQDHVMEYDNINMMPARLSFSQDYWGYNNGVSNGYLIPQNSDAYVQARYPSAMGYRNPNGFAAKFGLLNRITYPTKGTDSLIYEPNTIYDTRRSIVTINSHTSVQGSGATTAQSTTYSFTSFGSQNISLSLSNINDPAGTYTAHQNCIFEIFNASNILIFSYLVSNGDTYVTTVPIGSGTYTLKITAYGFAAIGDVVMSHKNFTSYVSANYEAGGVRLYKNISNPIVGPPVQKTYIYSSLTSQTISSGVLREMPNPDQYYSDQQIFDGDEIKQCIYINANSTPRKPLNYFSGGHIFYTDVIELKDGTWANGGIAHHFTGYKGSNATQLRGNFITGAPLTNDGMDNALETSTKTFITTGGSAGSYSTTTVSETITHYRNDGNLYKELPAYSTRRNWIAPTTTSPVTSPMLQPFDVAKYNLVRKWIYPDTITNITYDLTGSNPVTTHQVFLYNDTTHFQVNEVKTLMSDGRTNRILTKYPREMVNDGSTTPYQAMLDANIIIKPIVKSEYIDSDPIQEVKTNYIGWQSGTVYEPSTIQRKQGSASYETYIRLHDFDEDGNLLSQSVEGGSPISYKYGYRNSLVIAECKNAAPSEFYSENFEDWGWSITQPAHTGTKYYVGDFLVSWNKPNARAYKLTYWYLDGTAWKYAEQAYTGTITLTAGSAIDDINICPVDAQLTTYTYNTAAGIATMTDAKGMITYYEYDGLQRLKLIRNQHGDILKTYCYNLAGETTDCSTVAVLPATAPIFYQNFCRVNTSTGLKSAGISVLKVKNSSGMVLYSFTEAEMLAGTIYIAPGTYTFEYETYGSQWYVHAPGNYGWGAITTTNLGDYSYYLNYYSGSTNIHTLTGVVIDNLGYNISIDIAELIW